MLRDSKQLINGILEARKVTLKKSTLICLLKYVVNMPRVNVLFVIKINLSSFSNFLLKLLIS